MQECVTAWKKLKGGVSQRPLGASGASLALSRDAVAAALPSLHSWFHSAASAELGVF